MRRKVPRSCFQTRRGELDIIVALLMWLYCRETRFLPSSRRRRLARLPWRVRRRGASGRDC